MRVSGKERDIIVWKELNLTVYNITSTLKDQRSFCDPGITLNSPGTASKPM